MNTLNRLLVNIIATNMQQTKAFYTRLFDFEVDYDSDWFTHLISQKHSLELGIMKAGAELVPEGAECGARGFYLTLVVDNADDTFKLARAEGLKIISEPADTFYGQRRLILNDPEGTIVDVSSPIPDFKF